MHEEHWSALAWSEASSLMMYVPLSHERQSEAVMAPPTEYVLSSHTAVQSDDDDEQYDSQVPLETSAATRFVQLPLGMYMPASLHPAVQVREPPY